MAEKPAKKTSPARAAKVVAKKNPGEEVVLLTKKPTKKPKPTSTSVKAKKKSDDELRQEVAQRVVRKIFEEIGQPEAVRVRIATNKPSEAKQTVHKTSSAQPAAESTDVAVVLPSNASARVLSKAAALQAWYHKRFPGYVAKVATGLGILFLVFGGLGVGQFSVTHFPNWQDVQRAVLCDAANCILPPTAPIPPVAPPPPNASGIPTQVEVPGPAITFIVKPPTQLVATAQVVVRAEYAASLEVFAQLRSTDKNFPLSAVGNPAGSDYTYQLNPTALPVGEYELRARAVAARNGDKVYASGPRFVIPQTSNSGQGGTTVPPPATTSTPGTAAGTVPLPPPPPTPTQPTTSTTVPAVPPPPIPVPTNQLATTTAGLVPQIQLLRPEPGVVLFSVTAPDALGLELYAQRSNATEPYFLAAARKMDDGKWQHRLVLSQLPAANYFITARIKNPSGVQTTRGVVVEVSAPVRTTEATTTPPRPATIVTTEAVKELKVSDTPPPPRTQYAAPLTPPVLKTTEPNDDEETTEEERPMVVPSPQAPRPTVPPDINPIVKDRFDAEARDLNDLLKRYASAYQSGDEALKVIIDDEINRKRVTMVEEAVERGDNEVAANELDTTIAQEFTKLKARVETFESLLKERSGNSAATDSDSDGLSDFDEETLYDTKPTEFDTDGDGISDGAEIMRGFDPLDSAAETLLAFTSPKEFGLVREDVLIVETVTPVIETDTSRGQPAVQAEIKGKALPNSYVTLFIYSTPVIVTLKTDADGSFVYQFDKELEDGSHEVYVAVTDNTGDIIAKSSAFSFVKEAQAFTVTDAEATPVVPTEDAPAPTVKELYNVVLAMGVLAFGLILLIFGMVMRREPVVTETKETAPAV
jgi:hypothetical protein